MDQLIIMAKYDFDQFPNEFHNRLLKKYPNLMDLPEDECFLHASKVRENVYAKISISMGKRDHKAIMPMHRVALELRLGRKIADGMMACHTCDVKPCINPKHPWEGTGQENMTDMSIKERAAWGDKAANAAFTNEQIFEIAELAKSGMYFSDIAKKFNVTSTCISRIMRRETYNKFDVGFESQGLMKGEHHTNSILKNEDVLKFVELDNLGYSGREIEKLTGFSYKIISTVLSGKVWSHLTGITKENRKERNKKLTDEEVLDVVRLHREGVPTKDIAEKYNTSTSWISQVMCGKVRSEATGIEKSSPGKAKKVSDEQILKMVEEYGKGIPAQELADKYSLTRQYVLAVFRGDRKTELTGIKPKEKQK